LIVGLILIFNLLTCVYVQSQSWECPVSARKKLTPNSNMISDRCDFRFSKRLIETELRCSNPKISGEQSSSSDDSIQQLDVSANTINYV